MGTPIDPPFIVPPVPAGGPCAHCWGIGKPFGDDGTPESINISISGVNKSDDWIAADGEPVNGVFDIPQSEFVDCAFEYEEDFISIACLFTALLTSVIASNPQGRDTFSGVSDDPCELVIVNATADHFEGGTAVITIPAVLP